MPPELLSGKYELLHKLATGGMAEVFLARQRGLEGFEKLVVVKRILPHLAESADFVRMFLDEARTAADLRHQNVVTVFEVGEDGGTWFLVMEYLHGQNLRRVERAASEAGGSIPLAQSLRIVLDAANGLHYAHRKADLRGRALGIVHRDVSPQNIIVTYDGVAKIVDFGIARAASTTHETRSGVVRGKLSYMSPEQVQGEDVDHRSDQFSLAIVLYELVTDTRLFQKATDILTMHAVAQAEFTPPSAIVPDFPKALEAILRKSLAKEAADRYDSCADFALALEDFLASASTAHSATRLSGYLRGLFGEVALEIPLAAASASEDPTRTAVSGSGSRFDGAATAPVARSIPIGAVARTDGTPASGTSASELTRNVVVALQKGHTNLTADPGSFIGRESDLATLAEMASRSQRLITITGPGGAGKTRLARRFGAARLPALASAGGVWFCDLTEARRVEAICAAVGGVLGVALTSGGTEEMIAQIGMSLAGRGPVLLILDNLEQLVDLMPATVGRWLRLAPQAEFVGTSREVLGIPGESTYELNALSLPTSDADAEASEAVQLFVTRAKAVRRDFTLSAIDLPIVAEIVRRLEGMPLAIELAAARVGVLAPAKLLERLSKNFDLLATGRSGEVTSRHATLRKTIEWSWNLLSPPEQSALADVAVFRGGFTLDAAEEVVDLSEFDESPPVLDVIQSLRSKSLLKTWEPPELRGEIRFGMYSVISEFAQERLGAIGRRPEVEARHAAFYLRTCAEIAVAVEGPEGPERLHRLALEQENLISILHRGLGVTPPTRASATQALCALRILEPVLTTRGPFESHLAWLDQALSLAETTGVAPALMATILEQRGWIRRLRGLSDDAIADLRRAREMAAAGGDKSSAGRILDRLGSTLVFCGLRIEGVLLLEEARTRLAAISDRVGEARALLHLGDAFAVLGRNEDAREAYVRGLGFERERKNRRAEAMLLRGLGALVWSEGKLEEARECQERALPIAREYGDRDLEGSVHGTLAGICHEQGRFEEARAHYARAMALHGEVGKRWAQARWLGNRGILEHEQGQLREASMCYDGAAEWCAATGHKREEGLYRAYLGAVMADLDDSKAAERAFASAAKLLVSEEDELPRVALETLKGLLDVLHARAFAKAGDLAKAEEAQALAMRRIQTAGASAAEKSEDVRHALRLLRTRVQSAMGATMKLRRALRGPKS